LRKLVILLTCTLLAGCWQMTTRPYRDVSGVTVFAPGRVTVSGPDRMQHYRLARQPRGRYRLASIDKGEDFGEGFDLGFFPLPGAPSHVLVYQAAPLDHPRTENSLRYYGLMVVTGPRSAEEIRPDCDKDVRAARASRTRPGRDGACTFATRAGLEKSLLALWKSGKKPEYLYQMR
jgi:hypothetical protein